MLPQVLQRRERQREEFGDGSADDWLDCTTCKTRFNARSRRMMGCGYVKGAVPPRDLPLELGVIEECPGRLIRLPVVQEVTRAAYWAETGQLALYYEHADIPRNLFEYIELLESSKRQTEAEQLRQMRKGAKRGPQ